MPKAILEFTLPEETDEHNNAINGWAYKSILFDYDQFLRGLAKHGSEQQLKEFTPQFARDQLWAMIRDQRVEIT